MDAPQTCGEFLEMFRRKETNVQMGNAKRAFPSRLAREDPTLYCIAD